MALYIEVEPGDSVRIGTNTTIRMERKSGQRARLRIDSPEDVDHVKAGEEAPADPARAPAAQAAPNETPAPFQRRTPIPG